MMVQRVRVKQLNTEKQIYSEEENDTRFFPFEHVIRTYYICGDVSTSFPFCFRKHKAD